MLLREDLLSDRKVALAGPVPGGVAHALTEAGAQTEPLPVDAADEAALEQWAREHAPLHGLIYDAEAGGRAAGKIVLLAPGAGAGPLAGAVAAALENLARTLSVEWARYGITATAVIRGGEVANERLEELICFLVSGAGDYFSGCRFDVRAG